MRRTIAKRLIQAKQTVPHFYLAADLTIARLLDLRETANSSASKDANGNGFFRLSINDLLIKAWAAALVRVPDANAVWAEDRILRFQHADIGVAVAIEGGLIAPVIRRAEMKPLSAISTGGEGVGRARACEKARSGAISGRRDGDIQSRHVWGARVFRHHQPAAINHSRCRRGTSGGGGKRATAGSSSPASCRLRCPAITALLMAPLARNCWRPSRASSSNP